MEYGILDNIQIGKQHMNAIRQETSDVHYNWWIQHPIKPIQLTVLNTPISMGVIGGISRTYLLLAKIYNFWQVCSFVGLLLAKIYILASMFVCRFVCLSVCLLVCQFCQA